MTEKQAEVLRLAELIADPGLLPSDIRNQAASMLREYAEGVEVKDAMVERALVGYWGSDGGWNPERDQDPLWTDGCRKDMRAALTAALSGHKS